MLNIMLGEVIFGGVGAGLYGMVIFVILTVFIAGLMVGRTPEYLGKKIEVHEVKMAILAVLLPSTAILLFTALAVVTEAGLSSRANAGAHGFSEILYAFSSAAGAAGPLATTRCPPAAVTWGRLAPACTKRSSNVKRTSWRRMLWPARSLFRQRCSLPPVAGWIHTSARKRPGCKLTAWRQHETSPVSR
jgi:hypothetical protein